jgi:hypothetical protein
MKRPFSASARARRTGSSGGVDAGAAPHLRLEHGADARVSGGRRAMPARARETPAHRAASGRSGGASP